MPCVPACVTWAGSDGPLFERLGVRVVEVDADDVCVCDLTHYPELARGMFIFNRTRSLSQSSPASEIV